MAFPHHTGRKPTTLSTIEKTQHRSTKVSLISRKLTPSLINRINAHTDHKNCAHTYIHSDTAQPSQIPGVYFKNILHRVNGLREGVGEYSAEYSPYSRNKPFTPILPARMIFSPILYYRPGSAVPYIPPGHSFAFIARGIITGGGQRHL